jgi:hypothetical protein
MFQRSPDGDMEQALLINRGRAFLKAISRRGNIWSAIHFQPLELSGPQISSI